MRKTLYLNLILKKMVKDKIFEYDTQIYPRVIWIVYTKNPEVISGRFEYPLQFNPQNELGQGLAMVVNYIVDKESLKRGVLIWVQEPLKNPEIAHEAIHAAMAIFEEVGAVFEYNNQEPFCYLAEWIVEKIQKTLKAKNDGV